ncbi:ABC transporter permease [Myxococcota bacterium]|nr:ABC transporter permease [Myxococcota bacterium]
MGDLLRMALRNAARNTRRSALTALTILLGTTLLIIGLSWLDGLLGGLIDNIAATAGEVRVIKPEYEAREELFPLYENIAEVAPVVKAIEDAGFAAHPLIRVGVTISRGEEIGEHFGLLLGADRAYYERVMDLDAHLVDGAFFTPGEESSQVLLGKTLASDLGASVGDELLFLGQTQDGSISPIKGVLVGVVDAGDALSNRQAYASLERLQYLTDIPDGAIEVAVHIGDPDRAREVAATLRESPALKPYLVQAWSERPMFAMLSDMTGLVYGVLAGSIVFITALGVLNTMLMSVLERTAEVGVLRALGMGRLSVVFLFVVEALGIGALGAVPGVALGALVAYYLELNGVEMGEKISADVSLPMSTTFHADLSVEVALVSLALGLCMAALGALLPSIRAAGIQPVDAMRSHR